MVYFNLYMYDYSANEAKVNFDLTIYHYVSGNTNNLNIDDSVKISIIFIIYTLIHV